MTRGCHRKGGQEGPSQKTVSSEGRQVQSKPGIAVFPGAGVHSLCKGPGPERDCGLLKRQQGQWDKVKRGRRLKSISHRVSTRKSLDFLLSVLLESLECLKQGSNKIQMARQ